MNDKNKKDKGTFVRLSQEEMDMLAVLKQKHFINISRMFRESVRELYIRLENENHKINKV